MTLLRYTWAFPLTLLGLALAAIRRARSWQWRDGRIECIGAPLFGMAAIALGWCVMYREERFRELERMRRHEGAHVEQCLRWGPLLAVMYPASWLWAFARGPKEPRNWPRWKRAYYHVYWERKAREAEK